MNTILVLVTLSALIYPVRLQQRLHSAHVQSSQRYGFDNTEQCIGNCSYQANSPNFANSVRDPAAQQLVEAMPNGVFGFLYSSVSSILDYVYRLFVQPWIGVFGFAWPASIDRNLYTVEDRSTVDPPLTTTSYVNWHDMGTIVFRVLSSLLRKNQVRPLNSPATFPSTEALADSMAPLSAINPL